MSLTGSGTLSLQVTVLEVEMKTVFVEQFVRQQVDSTTTLHLIKFTVYESELKITACVLCQLSVSQR